MSSLDEQRWWAQGDVADQRAEAHLAGLAGEEAE
jgi:hypothetical protein